MPTALADEMLSRAPYMLISESVQSIGPTFKEDNSLKWHRRAKLYLV